MILRHQLRRWLRLSLAVVAMTVLGAGLQASAQAGNSAYPKMAPVAQYMMSRSDEIALARTAAPASISAAATVMVLTTHGYETAVPGTNGFVCLVERSWAGATDDPGFWNPNIRGPVCFNKIAAATQVAVLNKHVQLVFALGSRQTITAGLKAAFAKHELAEPLPGSICYMLSKQGYLDPEARNWRPHLMFFVPLTDAMAWGANAAGSPVLAAQDAPDRTTIFLVPVTRWSDGSVAPPL